MIRPLVKVKIHHWVLDNNCVIYMYPDQTWQEGVMVWIYDADFGNMCRKTLENDLGSRS